MQGESDLYNGSEYLEYKGLKLGQHPYFIMDDWTDGTIQYGGEWYQNVGLLYDICRDKVVIEHYYNRSMMELVEAKIGRFSLLDHTFVRLNGDKKNNLNEGFYDLLYDGNTKVYAQRVKLMEKTIEDHRQVYYFAEKTKYYILKDEVYYPVSNKASVLAVFEDRKREVKRLLAEKKIGFRQDRETAIAWMAESYDNSKR